MEARRQLGRGRVGEPIHEVLGGGLVPPVGGGEDRIVAPAHGAAEHLGDVDLAAHGPVLQAVPQQPEGGPHVVALGHLDAGHEAAVVEADLAPGHQAGRGEGPATPGLLAGGDDQGAVLDGRVVPRAGVVLPLAIAPAVEDGVRRGAVAQVEGPLGGVDVGAVELITPHQPPGGAEGGGEGVGGLYIGEGVAAASADADPIHTKARDRKAGGRGQGEGLAGALGHGHRTGGADGAVGAGAGGDGEHRRHLEGDAEGVVGQHIGEGVAGHGADADAIYQNGIHGVAAVGGEGEGLAAARHHGHGPGGTDGAVGPGGGGEGAGHRAVDLQLIEGVAVDCGPGCAPQADMAGRGAGEAEILHPAGAAGLGVEGRPGGAVAGAFQDIAPAIGGLPAQHHAVEGLGSTQVHSQPLRVREERGPAGGSLAIHRQGGGIAGALRGAGRGGLAQGEVHIGGGAAGGSDDEGGGTAGDTACRIGHGDGVGAGIGRLG